MSRYEPPPGVRRIPPGTEEMKEDLLAAWEVFKGEHDKDPQAWHRSMLDPPRTESDRCGFCGYVFPVDEKTA